MPPPLASEIVLCPRCCLQGHQAGLEAFKATVTLCHDWGIQALTVCAGEGGRGAEGSEPPPRPACSRP